MLLIDSREPKSIREMLEKSLPTKVVQLSCGDYISGRYAIERKTTSDFFQSLQDQRFWHQMSMISTMYAKVYLLIEGVTSPALYGKIKKVCNYVCMRYRVSILYTENQQHTALTLKMLYSFQGKPPPLLLLPRMNRQVQPQHAILCQFPGIGIKTARALLQKFGSLESIFQAPCSELKEVLGTKKRVQLRTVIKKRLYSESSQSQ